MKITEADLLAALTAAHSGTGPEEAKTLVEIAALSHVNAHRVRAALRLLQAEGRLQAHRVMRTKLNGVQAPVTGFTILPAKRRA